VLDLVEVLVREPSNERSHFFGLFYCSFNRAYC
jgi:hypothetical protein